LLDFTVEWSVCVGPMGKPQDPKMKRLSTPNIQRLLRGVLIEARHKAGLSQRAVAQRLGRHQSYVARYESGAKQRILMIEFIAIARALRDDPTRLLHALLDELRREGRRGAKDRSR